MRDEMKGSELASDDWVAQGSRHRGDPRARDVRVAEPEVDESPKGEEARVADDRRGVAGASEVQDARDGRDEEDAPDARGGVGSKTTHAHRPEGVRGWGDDGHNIRSNSGSKPEIDGSSSDRGACWAPCQNEPTR